MEPAFTYSALVTHVVDGDTLDVTIDLGFHINVTARLRLYGIDTPERGQAGHDEAAAALAVLTPVGSVVVARTFKAPEKYGRYLALVQGTDGRVVNDVLVERGLAKVYFGGSKSA